MKHLKKAASLIILSFAILLIAKPVDAEAAKPKLNKSKVTIVVGQGKQLKVKNTKKKVKWSTSAKKIAKVDQKGYVSAKKEGTAVITAKFGKSKLTCKVTVKEKPEIRMENDSELLIPNILCVGMTRQLKVVGTAKKVTWSSSKPKVVKISKKGVITGLKLGKSVIKAKVGNKTVKYTVFVEKAVEADVNKLSIKNGGSIEVCYYSNKIDVQIADESIAKFYVSDYPYGMATIQVFGLKTGSTKLTIKNDCNKEVVTIPVSVNKPEAIGEQVLVDWLIQNGGLIEESGESYWGIMNMNEAQTEGEIIAYDAGLNVVVMANVTGTDVAGEAAVLMIELENKSASFMYLEMDDGASLEDMSILIASVEDYTKYAGENVQFINLITFGVVNEQKQELANTEVTKMLKEVEALLYEKAEITFADCGLEMFSKNPIPQFKDE